jgi:oligopeptide transport system permease protein
MAENAIYIPQDSDFVPASEDHKKLTSSEAVTGSKNDMRKRFFAQKSAVAGMVILILLTFLALIGPYLTTHSYDDQQLERANLPPRAPVLSSWGIMDGSETINKTDGRVTVNRYEEL